MGVPNLNIYWVQVGATRALHVSNPLFLFVSVFSSLSLPLPRLLLSALSFFFSFFLSADLPPAPLPPTVCMPSLSLSLFLRLKICALLDIYIGDTMFYGRVDFEEWSAYKNPATWYWMNCKLVSQQRSESNNKKKYNVVSWLCNGCWYQVKVL